MRLKKIIEKEKPDLVIMGKQAIDNDSSQTGPILAAIAGLGAGDFCLQGRSRANEQSHA